MPLLSPRGPTNVVRVVCMHGTHNFLLMEIRKLYEFDDCAVMDAANWIIQQLRKEFHSISRVGYCYDTDFWGSGDFEKETLLTTIAVFNILKNCQLFHHREVRVSVQEVPLLRRDAAPLRRCFHLPQLRLPASSDEITDLFKCVEVKQKSFCPPPVEEPHFFDEKDVSFTDFLKKLESRQKDIMKRFQNVSFSSSDEDSSQSGIELGLDVRQALAEDIFQPQMPHPDQEIFFDTTDCFEKEPLLSEYRPLRSSTPNNSKDEEVASFLDKLIDDLLGKVNTLDVKESSRRHLLDERLQGSEAEKLLDKISADVSTLEKEFHMQNIAAKKSALASGRSPVAKLSMTVATSTDVQSKSEQTQAETQTDKESASEDEIAIIRHALAVIQKKKKRMSTIGKKSPDLKRKKLRSSRSPKCSCCHSEKKETSKEEKASDPEKKKQKEEKKEKHRRLEKKHHKKEKMTWAEVSESPTEPHFDLEEELSLKLDRPTSSEIDEPFNRKLREKWAHDGMKSLKKTQPITTFRLPFNASPNRFHRFQSHEVPNDYFKKNERFLDSYNLARLDGKIYKLIPRHSGNNTKLNKNYSTYSSVPSNVHMAIVDESDFWLNWEYHHIKVFRALNVGSRPLKKLKVEVLHSTNMEIVRDLSKIPDTVPIDFHVDFELAFGLIDRNKDGLCVMQLKDDEGTIVSPSFAFVAKKLDILPPKTQIHLSMEDVDSPVDLSLPKKEEEEKEEISSVEAIPPSEPELEKVPRDEEDEKEEENSDSEPENEEKEEDDYEKVGSEHENPSEESDFELVDEEDH